MINDKNKFKKIFLLVITLVLTSGFCASKLYAQSTQTQFIEINEQLANSPYNFTLHEAWHQIGKVLNVPGSSPFRLLKNHAQDHPKDSLIYQDYITQLSWNEQHALATALYQSTQFSLPQTYLLRAVAKSAKDSGDLKLALSLYTTILSVGPDDLDAQIGQFEVLLLDDQADSVIKTIPLLNPKNQQNIRIQRLLAQAHQQLKQAPFASNILQKLLGQNPKNPTLIQETATALTRSGMPAAAFDILQNNSHVFDDSATQLIRSAYNTYQVRLAVNEGMPLEQIQLAKKALEYNLTYLEFLQESKVKHHVQAIPFAHADRITLLNLMNDHHHVIQYFNNIRHLRLPDYGINIVAGSMLALKQPKGALELIAPILKKETHNYETLQLAYFAHIESENFLQAESYLQQLSDHTPIWLYSANPRIVHPNRKKATTDLMQALHFAYKNNNHASIKALSSLLERAPGNHEYWVNLAAIQRWNGFLKESRETLNLVNNTEPNYSHKTVEEIYLLLAERKYKQAIQMYENFSLAHPKHDALPQIKKELAIFNSNQVTINGRDKTSEGTRFSGREDEFNITFHTQPINYNWRLLATKSHKHAIISNTQQATINQYGLGVEYRWNHGTIQLQKTNTDHKTGTDWRFDMDYRINDFWSIGTSSQTFSQATPLRAFAQGITASSLQFNVNHQLGGRHQQSLSFATMYFNDDNTRKQVNLHANQQIFRNEHHQLFLHENLFAQKNSNTNDRPYFNPKSFYSTSLALDYEGILNRHYDRSWVHGLNIEAGVGNQADFGNAPMYSAVYQHKYFFNRFFNLYVGMGYSQQYYDGEKESGPRYLAGLEYKF